MRMSTGRLRSWHWILLISAASGLPVEEIRFKDTNGKDHTLIFDQGLRWCTAGISCPDGPLIPALTVRWHGKCQFQVMVSMILARLQGGQVVLANIHEATIAEPRPGPEQRELAMKMLILGRAHGVHVQGDAVEELEDDQGHFGQAFAAETNEVFPVPTDSSGLATFPIVVRSSFWSSLSRQRRCLSVVRSRDDCNSCAFAPWSCVAAEMRHLDGTEDYSAFELQWERDGLSDQQVCIRTRSSEDHRVQMVTLGTLVSFSPPKVTFLKDIITISIRWFVNPGWNQAVELECVNCSFACRLVVRPLALDPLCRSETWQGLAALASAAAQNQVPLPQVDMGQQGSQMEQIVQQKGSPESQKGISCTPPALPPCTGYAADALSMAPPFIDPSDLTKVIFAVQGSSRLGSLEQEAFFHRRSAICFYPQGISSHGWLVGFADVHMDGLDVQAFVCFVCFFSVVVPLACLITGLMHINKNQLIRQHVQRMRLEVQHEQLRRELDPAYALESPLPAGHSHPPRMTESHLLDALAASLLEARASQRSQVREIEQPLVPAADPPQFAARRVSH